MPWPTYEERKQVGWSGSALPHGFVEHLEATPDALCVASLNVHCFFGGMDAIVAFVRKAFGCMPGVSGWDTAPLPLDFLCMQEVSSPEAAERFAKKLGLYVAGVASADNCLYNVVLAKPAERVGVAGSDCVVIVAPGEHKERRAASIVRAQLRTARAGAAQTVPFTVACAHLDHISERDRVAQLEQLMDALGSGAHAAEGAPEQDAQRGGSVEAARRIQDAYDNGSLSQEGYTKMMAVAKAKPPPAEAPAVSRVTDANAVGHILIGDFNSLTRSDYSRDEMEKLVIKRRRARVSDVAFDVTAAVTDRYGFTDAASVCPPDLYPTSVYDVRVDYVFLSKGILDSSSGGARITGLHHVYPTGSQTDHALVVCSLEF
eukprot:Rhum_TRINITY_DN6905_c0_g1::Rhum_TRINITY_DN6905_c0_g1_i1::g.21210::m.21210